jgi:L-iditol 2-dehydrogenase
MRAAVMTDVESFEFEERERPTPAADEVVVRVRTVGICGSDLHFYHEGSLGDFEITGPYVPGHESAGEVAAVGEDVTDLAEGDRVAVEPGAPCRRCEFCKRGEYHLCDDVTFLSAPPVDGTFLEYVAWPADFVYELPESVSLTEGALCEPLSVAIHAVRRAGVSLDDDVLVTGAGPIGLLAMAAADAAGAGEVYVSDVVPAKLDRADARGAAGTIDVGDRDLVAAVDEFTDGRGVDAVVEASGAASVYGEAVEAVRRGGTVTCVGISSDTEIPFDFTTVTNRELTVNGSFRYCNTYPEAIDLVRRGDVDLAGLVDDEYPFEDIVRAFDAADDPATVKTMVTL